MFNHDLFVKLFEKLNLVIDLIKLKPHQLLARMDVNESHRDLTVAYLMQQKHHTVANLELRDCIILQYVLQLVSLQ